MSDEFAGQPQTTEAQPTQGAVTGAAPQSTPAGPAGESLPDNLKGKSADEIARMYVEAQRKIGEQGTELGSLRKIVTHYEAQAAPPVADYDPFAAPIGPPPMAPYGGPAPAYPQGQPQGPPQEDDRAFWDKPIPTVKNVAREAIQPELQRMEQNVQAMFAQQRAAVAQSNFLTGRQAAVGMRGDLLDAETRPQVESLLNQAWRNGYVDEASLANPRTWFTAATMVRAVRNNFAPSAPSAGTPTTFNETPSGNRVSQPEEREFRIAQADEALDTRSFVNHFKSTGLFKNDDDVAAMWKPEKKG